MTPATRHRLDALLASPPALLRRIRDRRSRVLACLRWYGQTHQACIAAALALPACTVGRWLDALRAAGLACGDAARTVRLGDRRRSNVRVWRAA